MCGCVCIYIHYREISITKWEKKCYSSKYLIFFLQFNPCS